LSLLFFSRTFPPLLRILSPFRGFSPPPDERSMAPVRAKELFPIYRYSPPSLIDPPPLSSFEGVILPLSLFQRRGHRGFSVLSRGPWPLHLLIPPQMPFESFPDALLLMRGSADSPLSPLKDCEMPLPAHRVRSLHPPFEEIPFCPYARGLYNIPLSFFWGFWGVFFFCFWCFCGSGVLFFCGVCWVRLPPSLEFISVSFGFPLELE